MSEGFRIAAYAVMGLIAVVMAFLRWKRVWKRRPFMPLAGLAVGLTFISYAAFGMLGIWTSPARELFHISLFFIAWSVLTTFVAGMPFQGLALTLGEYGILVLLSNLIFPGAGIYLSIFITLAFLMHYNCVYRGFLSRYNLFSIAMDAAIIVWFFQAFSWLVGVRLGDWVDYARILLTFASMALYFKYVRPETLQDRMQASMMKRAFRI